MNDKSVVKMVEERLDIADDGREEYAEGCVENAKRYSNYIDEASHPYVSNISLPWPYIVVESYLGKCVQMLAGVLPYVRVVEEDDDSRQKAKAVEKDANMVLYKQKWPILAYNLYKQAFKFGTAFMLERPWEVYKGEEMPVFSVMNWFKVWVNPNCLAMDDDDQYLIYETFIPIKTFQRFKGNPNYKNLTNIKAIESIQEIHGEEEKEIRTYKGMADLKYDPYSKLVKTWVYWTNEDWHIVTNEDNVIRNGKNFLGKIPVKAIKPIPVEDEFYGMSILEQGKDLFSEVSENRNQYNDAVNLMLNPQYIIGRNCDVKKTNITAKPGGIIWTEDVNGIKPLPVDWNLLTSSLQRDALVKGDIQEYSNAFPQFRGAPTGGADTATEYMGMRSAGELRSDTYNLLLSMMSIEDIVKDIVEFKQMFMTENSSGFYWPEQKTVTATPYDYSGNFSFKAYAQYKNAREMDRKQLIEAMTFIFGNQAFLPLVVPKANEWLERLLDYFNIRSPEQLYVSDEEMQMQQQMQQMQMMMGVGNMIPGGGKPQEAALGEREMRTLDTSPNTGMANNIPQA